MAFLFRSVFNKKTGLLFNAYLVIVTKLISVRITFLFVMILAMASCRSKETADKSDNDSVAGQAEESRARKPGKLTAEFIDTAQDNILMNAVLDAFFNELKEDYGREKEIVQSWPEPKQTIYIISQVEAEVNNGGFNQFFVNSAGQFAAMAPGAFTLIGANGFSDLVVRANRVYVTEYETIVKYQDGTVDGFSKSYKNNPLNALDDEFYALYVRENLEKLEAAFIRKNKESFIN